MTKLAVDGWTELVGCNIQSYTLKPDVLATFLKHPSADQMSYHIRKIGIITTLQSFWAHTIDETKQSVTSDLHKNK